jgi:hypothetical protein
MLIVNTGGGMRSCKNSAGGAQPLVRVGWREPLCS